jgi:glycosyltransferase involved in cell wall biosynthesis
MKEKQVLLILQVYNEIANIEQCVESIKSQNVNFLCLISDNVSTDGTREFLTSFVSRNPADFILISPKTHLDIATHFSFIYGYHDASFDVIPYRMIIGGDDYLDSPNFLNELISSIEKNPEFDLSVPIYQLQDESNNFTSNLSIRMTSQNSVTRTVLLAFYPTRLGNYNFVISLMKKDAFNFWALTLISFSEKNIPNSRLKKAEVIASFRLLQNHSVIFNDKATYVKRIHNPNRSGRLQPISDLLANKDRDFFRILRMHFQAYISIFSMAKEFRKDIKLSEYSWYLCLGFIAFIVGWLDFLYVVLSRRFSKLFYSNNHNQ